jgi:hypothetical protein
MLKLTWIGLFFNSFLPGAVTGDLIKLVYARDLDKDVSKTFLVTTVVMDRVLGLAALLSILGVSSIIYYSQLISLSPEMAKLIHFNLFLFLGAVSLIISLFLPEKFQEIILNLVKKVPLLGKKIEDTLTMAWTIGKNKRVVVKCLIISVALQLINFVAFYVISSPFYGAELPLPYVFTFIPIGFMAVAVPISPLGAGVGHYIFDSLFTFAGIKGGASFFNLFFICIVFVNLFGFLPYILSGKKHSLSETDQFEEAESKA